MITLESVRSPEEKVDDAQSDHGGVDGMSAFSSIFSHEIVGFPCE